jgi:hypothetical protein
MVALRNEALFPALASTERLLFPKCSAAGNGYWPDLIPSGRI